MTSNMTPRERWLASIHGEDTDRISVNAAVDLRTGPTGGWHRRLARRGLATRRIVPVYRPFFFFDFFVNPELEEVTYTQVHNLRDDQYQTRHILETPVGTISSVVARLADDPTPASVTIEHFIKEPEDWPVINYVFEGMLRQLKPNHLEVERELDTLGEQGYPIGIVGRTSFQQTWIELAGLDAAIFHWMDGVDGFLEFVDIHKRFHAVAAEMAAESPSKHIMSIENMTNTISPKLYEEFCLPIYKLYGDAFRGSDHVFAVHIDGLMGHLREQIKESAIDVVDSFSPPPSGDLSLSEAREAWPDKTIWLNLPTHLAFVEGDALRSAYEELIDECGGKRIGFTHVEDLPDHVLEDHIAALLDVCGY